MLHLFEEVKVLCFFIDVVQHYVAARFTSSACTTTSMYERVNINEALLYYYVDVIDI